jgi:hypothetical protein
MIRGRIAFVFLLVSIRDLRIAIGAARGRISHWLDQRRKLRSPTHETRARRLRAEMLGAAVRRWATRNGKPWCWRANSILRRRRFMSRRSPPQRRRSKIWGPGVIYTGNEFQSE